MFRWLHILRHPRWLLLVVTLLVAGALVSVEAWARYQYHAGQAALARFQHDAARVHFQRYLEIWPRSAAAHLLLARAFRRAGQFVQAEHHLDECRKWAPTESGEEVAFEWALLRATMGDLRSVEATLQARILSRPLEAPLIWEALAEGYRRTYRMPEALKCLDTWLYFEPDNAHAYFLRGELHRQVGAVNRARDEYRRVVELQPGHSDARGYLARCLVQVGRYQEAAQHIEILLRQRPDDPQLRTLLARSRHDLGERDQAIRLLTEVLRDYPGHGLASRERGRLALVNEEFANAETWLRQALTELPYDYEAHWGLYQALQGQGKATEARAQLDRAQQLKNALERRHEIQTHQMTLRPSDPRLHAELGELLIQIGQPEDGERWLHSSLVLDPGLAASHTALARLYDEQGNPAQAEQHRREAQKLSNSRR